MSYVKLEQAKQHLLVIHDEDDVLIQQNIDAAEAHAANYMNRPDIADDPVNPWRRNQAGWQVPRNGCRSQPVISEEPSDPVPKNVIQAILLLTAHFYENRVVGIVGTIYEETPTAFDLLWPNRVGMGI